MATVKRRRVLTEGGRTTRASTSAVANAGSPSPAWHAVPVASAVTRDECEEGNPPLPTMSEALNRPVMAHSLNGLSTCATTTAMSAATRPTLSPNVDPVPLKETWPVISETSLRPCATSRGFPVARATRGSSSKRPRPLVEKNRPSKITQLAIGVKIELNHTVSMWRVREFERELM